MARNKSIDLNDHLFEVLERLNDEDLEGEKLEEEINKAKSIAVISQQIIANKNNMLETFKYLSENDCASSTIIEHQLLQLGENHEGEDED